MVQQYFKASELKIEDKEEGAAPTNQPALYQEGNKDSNQEEPEKDQEAPEDDKKVIINEAQNEESKQAEETAVDDRGEEIHEDLAVSERGK